MIKAFLYKNGDSMLKIWNIYLELLFGGVKLLTWNTDLHRNYEAEGWTLTNFIYKYLHVSLNSENLKI